MFQTFDSPTSPTTGAPRVAELRAQMAAAGLDGFLVPRADMFQGEYVADCDARLAWLTGFTGSAGFAAVLAGRAGVFIDGRYRVQVKAQVDLQEFTPVDWPETKLADWLKEALPDGGVVGFDPWLHTVREVEALEQALAGSGITLQRSANLVDAIWADRPARPRNPVRVQPDDLAGEAHAAKRRRLAAGLAAAGRRRAILTQPDSICWLLNIRGADIPRNPVVQAMAVLDWTDQVQLFTDAPLEDDLRAHLGPEVSTHPLDRLLDHLSEAEQRTFQIDPATCPVAILDHLAALGSDDGKGIGVTRGDDPCALPKACKNAVEIAGARAAHLRDGAAMCEFLAWLDLTAPGGDLTEIDVVTELEVCRRATNALQEISFDTIAGAGPNGAIVHYRVTQDTNRRVTPGTLLLVDSGGQYLDGTTDITRTIAVGAPPPEAAECFTRVLKGMIKISMARFPKGIAGRDLDALARYNLWLAGQDYDHGTGHGVGSYLSVHEGPQRLSRVSDVPLQPGMILSNEPGYYREGAFGIRIENLIVVEPAPDLPGGDTGRAMLQFETLTFVPIDQRLILPELLNVDELAWLNAYHAEVAEKIGPRLSAGARDWLRAATAPL
ncbi:aminopeptidase P family protein [Actibacterium ureilyticum]|uniref:aminopeptidase P family protein n=1 Tax=Actibacterium ureilyticum TaxID=1590614 RepID=UPI000BAACCDF|nr:aminopeptidase P family protein [Actibacterium ureilyticum]